MTEDQGYSEAEYAEHGDRAQDRSGQGPISPSLIHLTLSDTALKFFDKYPVLHDFKPLVDQVVATNYFDDRLAEYYKFLVDELCLGLYMEGFGNIPSEAKIINIARMYMHQLIDGCKGGYRGKLATEIRRSYTTIRETGEQPRKSGWWPF